MPLEAASVGDLGVVALFEGRIVDRWGPDDTTVAPGGGAGVLALLLGYDSHEDQRIEFAVDLLVAGDLPDRFLVDGWGRAPCWDPEPGELLVAHGPPDALQVSTVVGGPVRGDVQLVATPVPEARVPAVPHPVTAVRWTLRGLVLAGAALWLRRRRRRAPAPPGVPLPVSPAGRSDRAGAHSGNDRPSS